MLGLDGFELDSDFLTRDNVDSEIDITYRLDHAVQRPTQLTERTTTDLLADPVLSTDSQVHGRHSGMRSRNSHRCNVWSNAGGFTIFAMSWNGECDS